jgi:hypothetical protein
MVSVDPLKSRHASFFAADAGLWPPLSSGARGAGQPGPVCFALREGPGSRCFEEPRPFGIGPREGSAAVHERTKQRLLRNLPSSAAVRAGRGDAGAKRRAGLKSKENLLDRVPPPAK